MAFAPTSLSTLRMMLEHTRSAARLLEGICEFMEENKIPDAFLKSESRMAYAQSLHKFASESDIHVRDQYACSLNGEEPQWKRSTRKSVVDMERKKAADSLNVRGLIKSTKPAKKASKRKSNG